MESLSERDRRALARDRVREADEWVRQVDELRQLRERDRLINLEQERALNPDAGQLIGAQGGAVYMEEHVSAEGQRVAGSVRTQWQDLSELSQCSLSSEHGHDPKYPPSIESSLRRAKADQLSAESRKKGIPEPSFMKEQSSQHDSKQLEIVSSHARGKDVDQVSTGSRKKSLTRHSLMREQTSQHNSRQSVTRQRIVSSHQSVAALKEGDANSRSAHMTVTELLSKQPSLINVTGHNLPQEYSKQTRSLSKEQDSKGPDIMTDYNYEEERALKYRINRILSEDRVLKEERKNRIKAEEELQNRLENLRITQQKMKEESDRHMRIEALKDEEQQLNRDLLNKVKMDREREHRILAMHRECQLIEEDIKMNRRKPSIRYDPHVKREIAQNDQVENERQAQMRQNINSEEAERINRLEIGQQQLLMKVQSQEEELLRKNEAIHMLEQEIKKRADINVRQSNENEENELEITRLEQEKTQLLLQQKEFQNSEKQKETERQTMSESTQKEKELQRKEEYLKKLEHDLLKKEEELSERIRKGSSMSHIVERERQPDVIHPVKPNITPFSGADPIPKNESCFEDWRVEIQSIIESGRYPDYVVTQLIRNALKQPAKKAVLTLGASATSVDLLAKLENVFGNVSSGDSVLTEFYTSAQKQDESVTMWGLRLEQLVQRGIEKGEIVEEKRDHMLRHRFWRYLYDTDLQNATVIHFDQIKNFDELRAKVKTEELWRISRKSETTAKDTKDTSKKVQVAEASAQVQHQPLNLDPNAKTNRDILKRLETLEEDLQYRKSRRQKNWDKMKNKNEKDKDQTEHKTDNKSKTEQKHQPPLNK